MTKNNVIFALVSALLFSTIAFAGTYSGGTGEPNTPYQIADANDWQELMTTSDDWDKHFLLAADIDLTGVTVTPVGNTIISFGGIFDGNGHIISNSVINLPNTDYIGLFGYIYGGEVKNLGIEDANITGGNYVGGLVGYKSGGTSIISCYATGDVNGVGGSVGGLVGANHSTVTSCYSIGVVNGNQSVGGLVGYNFFSGSINSCYATGVINGEFQVGGLVGENLGNISFSYATGSVNGNRDQVGGLVGYNRDGNITSCSATGSVSGDRSIGGLVGTNGIGSVTSCDATGSVNGSYTIGGLIGENDGGSVNSCRATSSVTGAGNYVGGLVGRNYFGSVISCKATGSVIGGGNNVGGLIGYNWYGSISSCYTTGSVSGTENHSNVGGLIGFTYGEITNCYNGASVFGYSKVGGLVGENHSTVTSCYSIGVVNGNQSVGGLVGYNNGAKVIRCYSTGQPTGTSNVGGLCGYKTTGSGFEDTGNFWDTDTSQTTTSAMGSGRTTAEMMTLSTFTFAGWDFSDTDGDPADWMMLRPSEDYPRLIWQEIFDGDIAGLYGVDNIDLEELTWHWLQSGCPTDCEDADIDGSGTVDLLDYAILAADWFEGI